MEREKEREKRRDEKEREQKGCRKREIEKEGRIEKGEKK